MENELAARNSKKLRRIGQTQFQPITDFMLSILGLLVFNHFDSLKPPTIVT